MKNGRIRFGLLALSTAAAITLGASGMLAQVATPSKAQIATLLAKAKAGNADAQESLGVLYGNGEGIPQDYAQAASWYRKAADQGDVDAQWSLGAAYQLGQGVPQDSTQAASWYRKAADQGDATAQRWLGELYANGEGVPQDHAQAVIWYQKAADQGDADAQKSLAEIQGTAETQVPHREQQDRTLVMSSRDIARVAFKSVVLLQMDDSNGQPLSLGSGFFVSDGIIATNAHVIEGASSGTAKLVGDTHTMQILGAVAVDRNADLALLKVDSPAPSLALGPSTSPTVGDNVYVVGNPFGLEGTFSEGIISGLRHVDADSILQMTAPISPGSSGGPVMDSSGAVIGIAVATFEDGQNLNLAVPVSYLFKLLASPSKDIIPLGNKKLGDQAAKSMLDGLGTKTENGVTVSNYQLGNEGNYEFRLTNKLPVGISDIRFLILYYDASGSLMDFENFSYYSSIPAGLTKTIVKDKSSCVYECGSEESRRAAKYYGYTITPKVEIRVIGFSTEKSQ